MLKEVAIVRLKISESERITPKFEFMEQILELEANRERERERTALSYQSKI